MSTTSSPAETTLWKGHTSQWTHFWYYLICLVLAAFLDAPPELELEEAQARQARLRAAA